MNKRRRYQAKRRRTTTRRRQQLEWVRTEGRYLPFRIRRWKYLYGVSG